MGFLVKASDFLPAIECSGRLCGPRSVSEHKCFFIRAIKGLILRPIKGPEEQFYYSSLRAGGHIAASPDVSALCSGSLYLGRRRFLCQLQLKTRLLR